MKVKCVVFYLLPLILILFSAGKCNRLFFVIFRLEISCDNQSYGCEVMIKLDLLPHHLKECEHNPKKKVSCEQGCGLTVPKDEMKVTIDLF